MVSLDATNCFIFCIFIEKEHIWPECVARRDIKSDGRFCRQMARRYGQKKVAASEDQFHMDGSFYWMTQDVVRGGRDK